MDNLWIFFLLLAITVGAKAQSEEAAFPDYWSNENWYDDEEEVKVNAIDDKQDREISQEVADIPDYYNGFNNDDNQNDESAIDTKVENEIQDFRSKVEDFDLKDLFANDRDYQYEDNRSDLKDERVKSENAQLPSDSNGNFEQKDYDGQIQKDVEDNQNVDLSNLGEQSLDLDEKKNALEDDNESNDYENVMVPDAQPNLDQIVEETKAILKETDDLLDEGKIVDDISDIQLASNEVHHSAPVEETIAQQNLDNQSSEPKSEEINDESEETLSFQNEDKISSEKESENAIDQPEETNASQNEEQISAEKKSEKINGVQNEDQTPAKSEEMVEEAAEELTDSFNKKSYDDDDINHEEDDSNKDNIDNIVGIQLTDLNEDSETIDDDYNVQDYEEKNNRPYREGEVLKQRDYDYQQVDDENLDDIFEDLEKSADGDKIDETDNEDDQQVIYHAVETIESEESVKSAVQENAELDVENENDEAEEVAKEKEEKITLPLETNQIDDTNSSEYNELMKTFAQEHKEDMDFNAPGFDRNIAPIHITLNTDEAVIVESPNYPNPYPTNNIVDWIFDGDGMGIEFNLTDFAVNGALGDYLLIKPGGIDETGNEGLIFSYTLDEPRMYRFLNVDKMFVRFESKLGMAFTRGFSFSIKLVGPRPEIANIALPEEEEVAEPLISAPNSTLTLTLGGITLQEFQVIKEQFRMIVADMATMYINTKNINQGLYTTMEVTQITSAVMCNLNWPNFEVCSEVSFGVPLHYEQRLPGNENRLTQEELQDMWEMFAYVDPFASRIRRLGITDFATPNDVAVLSMWLVLLLAALVAAAVLALVLWRYSCKGKNYKRMPSFSEEGRIEKPGLDLYPTPHQTLPPLYSHSDYKWAESLDTRVDVGGFSNKSYTPDELDELDSEDDVINQHRTQDNVGPKDIYQLV